VSAIRTDALLGSAQIEIHRLNHRKYLILCRASLQYNNLTECMAVQKSTLFAQLLKQIKQKKTLFSQCVLYLVNLTYFMIIACRKCRVNLKLLWSHFSTKIAKSFLTVGISYQVSFECTY
jgi:hypothetical protein